MYAICRQNRNGVQRAWVVSLFRGGRQVVAREFVGSVYGGLEEALVAARRYRDEVLRQFPLEDRLPYRQTRKANNTSGIPGVAFRPASKKFPAYWCAETQVAVGKRLSKCFFLSKYDYETAKCLAIKERQKQLLLVEDRYSLYQGESRQLCAGKKLDT